MQSMLSLRETLSTLNANAREFAALGESRRNEAILAVAQSLQESSEELLAENAKDLHAAKKSHLAAPLLKRLALHEHKIAQMLQSLHAVAAQSAVVGVPLLRRELDSGLVLSKLRCPIGLIAFIFESRPDAFVQMLSLSLKSANALVLKGGSEALHSNACLFRIIEKALLRCAIPSMCYHLTSREEVHELLRCDDLVGLVIPRGSKEFVRNIMQSSAIPVLGHADGICHVYVDKDADADMARDIVVDAKTQYVAVCNAAETLLVHREAETALKKIAEALLEKGVRLRGDAATRALIPQAEASTEEDWSTEYLDLILSIGIVDSLEAAVSHINTYGSQHTDVIVTENPQRAQYFTSRVVSANTFVNCSTRFSDGYRYGLGAESGISTGKLHARGPVGIEGLTTYRWVLEGKGHVVADYEEGRSILHHRELEI